MNSSTANVTHLSPEEMQIFSQFHFQKDRDCYLLTRSILRMALSTYFPGTEPKNWKFQKNEYGKPSLAEDMGHPPLSFNISHSHGKVLCAFSSAASLGVDLEMVQADLNFVELAKSHFSEIEYQNLIAQHPNQLATFFFRYWTLKESYIKAKGLGLNMPLHEFSFDFSKLDDIRIQFHGSFRKETTDWKFQLFEPWPQTQAAISLKSPSLELIQVASSFFAT